MTKVEYMKRLSGRLKKLPKDSYAEAMEYFDEYFAEAGSEEEAIENLGIPEDAARQIITNLAIQKADESERSAKKGFSAIWIGVLAIFAAPIGLPIAVAIAAVALAVVITVIAVMISVLISVVVLVLSSIFGIIASTVILFTNPMNGIATLGAVLLSLGCGILILYACVAFCRWLIKRMASVFGKIARKGKGHEGK